MSSWNKGYCSWFWDRIFGVDIGLECYDHDAAYAAGGWKLKFKADLALAVGIWNRSEGLPIWKFILLKGVSVGSYVLTSTVGWGFWLKTRLKEYRYADYD